MILHTISENLFYSMLLLTRLKFPLLHNTFNDIDVTEYNFKIHLYLFDLNEQLGIPNSSVQIVLKL